MEVEKEIPDLFSVMFNVCVRYMAAIITKAYVDQGQAFCWALKSVQEVLGSLYLVVL